MASKHQELLQKKCNKVGFRFVSCIYFGLFLTTFLKAILIFFHAEKAILSTASSLPRELTAAIDNSATVSGFVLNLPPTDVIALSFKAKFCCFVQKEAFLEMQFTKNNCFGRMQQKQHNVILMLKFPEINFKYRFRK